LFELSVAYVGARGKTCVVYGLPWRGQFWFLRTWLDLFDVSTWCRTLSITRVAELYLHITILFVAHRSSGLRLSQTSDITIGYPLAPWTETNRQSAISRSRYSVRTICGDARCELRTGSYRSSMAGCVGVRRRRLTLWRCAAWIAHGITSVATLECQENRRLLSVRSECGDAR